MHQRRRFLIGAGAFVVLTPASLAQVARRVGLLSLGTPETTTPLVRAFAESLRDRGHADAQIEARFALGQEEDLPRLAAEIAARRPAVFVAPGTVVVAAVRKAAPGVPIVTLVGDVVSAGVSPVLAKPVGGVTGVNFQSASLDAKRLELLAAVVPKGKVIVNLADPSARPGSQAALGDAARALGIVLHTVEARAPQEIDAAFAAARKLEAAAVNVLSSPFLNTHRARIMRLAENARLPAIYQWPETAEEGGLMGYGPRLNDMYRQLAGYVARILEGASPADLPIQQPAKLELVVNLKTARSLRIAVPQSLLLRADRVIE